MSTFKSVVTTLGQARIAAAIAAGTDINITQLAVGDGNGKATTPVATQTKLVKEVYRTPLNSLKLDPSHGNWVIAEAVLSATWRTPINRRWRRVQAARRRCAW